jgi:hypothetical protein
MNHIAHRRILTADSEIVMRLGEVFLVRGSFLPLNSPELDGLLPLALLVVAIKGRDLYFTMVGLDNLGSSVSVHRENSVMLIDKRGREVEISDARLLCLFKKLPAGESARVVDGVSFYFRTAIANKKVLRDTSLRKLDERLIDIADWPGGSIEVWALRQLELPHRQALIDEGVDTSNFELERGVNRAEKRKVINKLLQTKIFLHRAQEKKVASAPEKSTGKPSKYRYTSGRPPKHRLAASQEVWQEATVGSGVHHEGPAHSLDSPFAVGIGEYAQTVSGPVIHPGEVGHVQWVSASDEVIMNGSDLVVEPAEAPEMPEVPESRIEAPEAQEDRITERQTVDIRTIKRAAGIRAGGADSNIFLYDDVRDDEYGDDF